MYGGDTYLGRQIFPAGTRVDASTGADGKVSVTTEYGATAYLPADGVHFDPIRPKEPPALTPALSATPRSPRADSTPTSVDITTLSGSIYHDAQAYRVEPDGVTIKSAEGWVKIPFEEMPEKYRLAYHYDPEAAGAYRPAVQTAIKRQAQEQEAAAAERRAEQARSTPPPDTDSLPLASDDLDVARKVPVIDAQGLIDLYESNEISADRLAKRKGVQDSRGHHRHIPRFSRRSLRDA